MFRESWSKFVDWHKKQTKEKCISLSIPFVDCFEFPITNWKREEGTLHEYLATLFKLYRNEVETWSKNEGDSSIDIFKIDKICNQILSCIAKKMDCDDSGANESMEKILNIIGYNLLNKEISGNDNKTLFRLRTEKKIIRKEDMFHIPFNKRYLCGSYRFSQPGYPGLYLAYSKECRFAEVSSLEGTIAEYRINGKFNLFDLTFNNQKGTQDIFLFWPILAACYVAPPRTESPLGFKEEYIFPQLLTSFLLNKKKKHFSKEGQDKIVYDGIRYYSCRNKELNPMEDTYVNIAFFAIKNKEDEYDNQLLKDFQINITV